MNQSLNFYRIIWDGVCRAVPSKALGECQWCGAGVRDVGLWSGAELRDLLSLPVSLWQV